MSYYRGTVLVGGPLLLGSISKTKTFSGIFWVLPIDNSLNEEMILGVFVYLIREVTTTKLNLPFTTLSSLA